MKFKVSKNALYIIEGITLCLFSLMCMLSATVFGVNWIATGILASVGFIGFWVFLPGIFLLGLYLIFAKRFVKMKFDLSIFGFMITLFFVSVMVTNLLLSSVELPLYDSANILGEEVKMTLDMSDFVKTLGDGTTVTLHRYLEIKSFIYYFLKASEIGFVQNNFALGGGFVGFMFASMLNSWLTPVGTTIFSISFIVVGIILVFNIPLWRFVKFLIAKIFKKKDKTQPENNNDDFLETTSVEILPYEEETPVKPLIREIPQVQKEEIKEIKEEEIPPLEVEENLFDDEREEDLLSQENMVLNSFNNSHTIQKATFSMFQPTASHIDETKEDHLIEEPSVIPTANFDEFNEEPTFLKEVPVTHNKIMEERIIQPEIKEEVIIKEEIKPALKVDPDALSLDISSRRPRKAKKLHNYHYPDTNLIIQREKPEDREANKDSNDRRAQRINDIFAELSLGAHVVSYTVGPSFTRFDVQMDSNKSVTTIDRFIPDLASRLGGIPVRFEKLVIGKSTSGLEVGNDTRTVVGLKECLETLPPVGEKSRMLIPFGKDIDNKLVYADLTKFPHMLVAGSTGSGKSVFMHSVIVSLIMRNKPDELKLLLIDPKRVEMNAYRDIPHLLCPNISEPNEALVAFNKLVEEMERRYSLFSEEYVNEIRDYNEVMEQKGLEKLPYIVIFVDEYADLSESCKEIRSPVVRIAQKARAAGIHLVLATQRPSVNVIDGVIKANISTHVALMVNNATDSMVILGEGGAESLSGNGDMIVDCALISRQYKPRLQGAYCTLGEINKICNTLREQMPPQYDPAFLDLKDHSNDKSGYDDAEPIKVDKDMADEELYKMIREDIASQEYCSISRIQRGYGIGFPRAGRMFARLQKEGLVEQSGDARGCKVLIHQPVRNEQQMGSVEQSSLRVVDED